MRSSWQTPPNDIWHRIAASEGRYVMKIDEISGVIEAADMAVDRDNKLHVGGERTYLTLSFPDRVPPAKMRAIRDAINAALAAAREIEGAGRD